MFLDTHVVAWLYAGEVDRFTDPVRQRLETEALAISPMVVLELQYLFESGRVTEPAARVVSDLERRIGLEVLDCSFADLIDRASALSWTRDPFDRIIAAHASVEGRTLLTADKVLLSSLPEASWE